MGGSGAPICEADQESSTQLAATIHTPTVQIGWCGLAVGLPGHASPSGDRPVQIGSHIHLPDTNAALDFDRSQAEGFRLDIPAGTSQRFEPGASRTVPIVSLGGRRRVPGIRLPHAEAGDR